MARVLDGTQLREHRTMESGATPSRQKSQGAGVAEGPPAQNSGGSKSGRAPVAQGCGNVGCEKHLSKPQGDVITDLTI